MSATKTLVTLSALLAATSTVLAQESASTVDDVTRASQVFEGKVLKAQSTVRSGPSENYYPVDRLSEGTLVVINGIKFDWLRVVPPEGTFSLVAKQFVDVSGPAGKIKSDNVNVRAGSNLNAQYATIQTKLMKGDSVSVMGEVETRDGVFLKIKPPPGAYLYIHKDLVAPVRVVASNFPEPRLRASTSSTPPTPAGTEGAGGTTRPSMGTAGGTPVKPDRPVKPRIPVTDDLANATPRAPTTQELAAATAQERAEKAYDEADRAWQDAMNKPIEEQPLPELLSKFEALANNEDLPVTLRRQAISTVGFIKARNETKQELLAVRKQQEEMQARLKPLRDQNQQLQEKFRQLDMTTYTAVGQLQTSAMQQAGVSLLRLIDPKTSHTLVYIRSSDAGLVGQFVGVKGDITRDEQLNIQVISPKTIVTVDPSVVGKGISAEIMPADLRPASPVAPTAP